MGSSSHPAYFDPSSNWHQQQSHQIIGSTSINPLLPSPTHPGPQPPPHPHGVGAPHPGSTAERARMANIPMPETTLKCPRCESSNTKFCYYNNYNLSQPRHFCKTCRRYWTRGGALRNVPVGGGCRRNKRSKSTSSKSPANQSDGQTTSGSTSSMSTNSGASTTASILGLTPPSQLAPLRFLSPLGQLTDSFTHNLGLGISAPMVGSSEMNFHNNFLGGGGVANFLSGGGGGIEPWRLQQFPFLGGLESNLNGIYQFQGGESGFLGGEDIRQPKFSASMLSQLASVKMEHHNAAAELNLSRQLLGGGVPARNTNENQWNNNSGAGASPNWTDLSSFSSSSTSNPL